MIIATLVMAVLAVVLFVIALVRGEGEHIRGLQAGLSIFVSVLPLLFFALIVAGMVEVLIPRHIIAGWIGEESGFRGILLGSIAGGLTPGGPYVSLPIVAGLLKSGAGIGTVVAFLTGWSLIAVGRLPMEVGFLGWKVTLARFLSTLLFPPVAGLIAQTFFRALK